MTDKTFKILRSVFWALLAVVLMWFSFRDVDWKEFWKVILASRWAYVALAMAAGVFSFIFRAMRWRLLIIPVEPEVKAVDCYDGFTIGRLFNYVIPYFGEFVRCSYVQTPRLTFDKSLGTVALERTWDILVLLLLIVIILFFRGEQFSDFFVEKMLEPAAVRLGANIWWVLAALALVIAAVVWAVCALRRRKSRAAQSAGSISDDTLSTQKGPFIYRITAFFRGLAQGFSSVFKMKGKGWFLILTVLLWLMFLLMSWFIIKALPIDTGLDIVDALFIMLVGSVAGIVPVPGGFGAFHYIVALALQTIYSIPFETGIIFATLSHESQAVTTILCGLVSYVHRALRRR